MMGNAVQIELRSPASMRAYAGNARTHNKKQVRQIADSIARFGFTNPVLISESGEIIAGHGRVMAATLIGMLEVPTLRLAHLSEAERRAYVIADNKLALNAGSPCGRALAWTGSRIYSRWLARGARRWCSCLKYRGVSVHA